MNDTPRSSHPGTEPSKPDSPRGRDAATPAVIPRRGWLDIFKRVRREAKEDRIAFEAAAVSFYFLLAMVPALTAIAGIYGLVSDPAEVVEQLDYLEGVMPSEAYVLVESELTALTRTQQDFSVEFIFGFLLAIWGSTKGVEALMKALNVIYEERETRSWVKRKLVVITIAAGGIAVIAFVVALLGALPAFFALFPSSLAKFGWVEMARWPVLCAVILFALAVVYRFTPCRRSPKWAWVSPGSLCALVLWVPASYGLTLYGGEAGKHSATYGSLSAVVLLMLWFYITVLAVLLGGELNAECEHQTAKDSTRGEDRPMGERGAVMADTLGTIETKKCNERDPFRKQ